MKNNSQLQRGFTVVELLVAMGVFIVVIGMVSNIFVNSLRNQQATVALMLANDNACSALEQMYRELRTGGDFTIMPANVLAASGDAIRFTNASDETVVYRKNGFAVERGVCDPLPSVCDSLENHYVYLPLTAKGVVVASLQFYIVSQFSSFGSSRPPRITIALSVGAPGPSTKGAQTNLQTTVSALNL